MIDYSERNKGESKREYAQRLIGREIDYSNRPSHMSKREYENYLFESNQVYLSYETSVSSTSDKNKSNCVLWARAIVPELPYGLITKWNKKNIINSEKPKVGSVAIIDAGIWGHVAVVTKIEGSYITIKEANWRAGEITERRNTAKNLQIIGYFDPGKRIF